MSSPLYGPGSLIAAKEADRARALHDARVAMEEYAKGVRFDHLKGLIDPDIVERFRGRNASDNDVLLAQLIKEMSAFRKTLGVGE